MSDDDSNQIQKIDLDRVDWKSSREFFESLGEELDKLDNKDESYDFTWVGKRKAVIEAGAPINKTLRPNVKESKDWDTTENLFIEGDNLDALKLLQESYLGKVKIIYIDPPYNTGKDFVYHDNFKASIDDYDEDTEYKDEKGYIQFKKNEKTNGRYHSDWLSMMYPRLKLARNLLSDDGLIFISIGADELANLRKLSDEVYGEDNFISMVSREQKSGSNQGEFIAPQLDYILIYAKNKSLVHEFVLPNKEMEKEQEKSLYQSSLDPMRGCSNQRYWIQTPDGSFIIPPGDNFPETVQDGFNRSPESRKDKVWRWSYNTYLAEKQNLRFKDTSRGTLVDENGNPSKWNVYSVKSNLDSEMRPRDYIFGLTNAIATSEVKELKLEGLFENPKPTELLIFLLSFIRNTSDIIVLDFFSGSGTTAHAVMQLNADDGGNRKHIQVQLPEPTEEKSEAYKAGYKSIPEIARERIRRAGEKIKEEFKDELTKREKPLDVGFRTLTVSDTNYKEVFKSVGQHTQESLLDTVDNVKEDRSELDLLYGVLVQSALELNRPIEKKILSGADVYVYDYFGEVSGLVACFADSVPEDTIKEIAKLKPLTAVFKDSSFESSQDKVNLAEHFRIISPDTKVKVV